MLQQQLLVLLVLLLLVVLLVLLLLLLLATTSTTRCADVEADELGQLEKKCDDSRSHSNRACMTHLNRFSVLVFTRPCHQGPSSFPGDNRFKAVFQ
jgi:hypothetical protein